MKIPVLSLFFLVAVTASGTAQITAEEYAQRRSTLASQVPDGVFIVRGAESPVQDYLSFYQNNGMLYLSGYREPDTSSWNFATTHRCFGGCSALAAAFVST